jgi:hypothetical protein
LPARFGLPVRNRCTEGYLRRAGHYFISSETSSSPPEVHRSDGHCFYFHSKTDPAWLRMPRSRCGLRKDPGKNLWYRERERSTWCGDATAPDRRSRLSWLGRRQMGAPAATTRGTR